MIDPVIKEITVAAPHDLAFEAFTTQMASWWPVATHSLSVSDGKLPLSITLTPNIGGAIQEVLHDGTTAKWGIITEWEPGRKLAFTWHLRRPESEQTHVSVEFLAQGDETVIKLVHEGWGALGDDAAEGREQYNSGWDTVLAQYVTRCAA